MAVDSRQATPATHRAYGVIRARWVNGPGDSLDITFPRIRIGRQPGNDIIVEHSAISGEHLELDFSQGRALARDLGSTNRTYLDGRALPPGQPVTVPPGGVLRLGAVLELELLPPDASRPPFATPPRLRLLSQGQPGVLVAAQGCPTQRVALSGQTVRVGRRPENDIVIEHPAVSGAHAEIVPHAAGQFQIVDLESRNGLWARGQRFRSKPLRAGEEIRITDQVRIEFMPAMCFVSVTPEARKTPAAQTRFLDLHAQKTMRIGRAADNDLRIDDSRVSRYHAVLERVGMRYRIRDLRSDGGTFVNGKRVEREQFIQEGDVIHIANVKLKFAEDGLQQTDARGLRLDLLNLHKVVDKKKDLLQDISLSIYPHEFVALVGTSGAGKSTLLDAMNGFRPATHGQVLVNGVSLYKHFDAYRTEMGYVPQDDIMHRELTVYEALDYAARLRMPSDTSPTERGRRIKEVLQDLDLEARATLPINKLSGGQRKRVSIGIELITRPSLFFLDEATSGLDPGTELELMQLLRQLTEDPRESRTIILITHATKNVMLCDQVIFLTKGGYLAFFGPPDQALEYFDQYRSQEARRLKPDFEFDDIYNLLDVDKALPEGASEREKLALAAEWARRYRQSPQYQKYVAQRLQTVRQPTPAQAAPAPRQRPRASAFRQFGILSQRHWSVLRRDTKGLAILLLQAPLIGLSSFASMGGDTFDPVKGSVADAMTTLFLAVIIVLLFGTVNAAREFTKELAVYKRERMVNLKIAPYVFSKVFVGLMFCLYQVGIYLIFTLFTTDWPPMDAAQWASLYFTLSLASLSGVMLGLLLSALSTTDGQAVALIPVILIPQFIFAGVLMPDLAKAPVIPYIATSRWATTALATITQADLAGSQNPDIDKQISEAKENELRKAIAEEGDKAVAEELDAEVAKQLPAIVKAQTDEILASETRAAQDRAEAQARRQMSLQPQPPPPAMVEQQVAQAREQARRQVAAQRPKIEAEVRASAEPTLRLQVEKAIRDKVADTARAKADSSPPPENPARKAARENFGDIFDVNVVVNWTAMILILAALLGFILVLQKRKDVI